MVQIIATSGAILGVILGAAVFDKENIINANILFLLSCFIFGTAFSYIATLGIQNVLRYHYIQRLEDQAAFQYQKGNVDKISFVQWMSFCSPITTRNPSHLNSKFAIVFYLSYTVAILCATFFSLGVIAFLYYKLENRTLIDTIVIISLAAIIIIIICFYVVFSLRAKTVSDYAFKTSLRKKRQRILKSFIKSEKRPYNKSQKITNIILYFIYPKNKDLQKTLLIFIGYLTGTFLIRGYNIHFLKENFYLLILSLFIIDFLIYQARYQWNDIRGVHEDVIKTDRLPIRNIGKMNSVVFSLFVICIRLLIVTVVLYGIRNEVIFPSLCLNTVLIIILAILYEWGRTREKIFLTFFWSLWDIQ
ncbi:MAG: hypothetical protein HFG28_10265 [Eubacterium sp.]|nr:hypothetical protein [Eubacterium sp.]